MLPIEELTAKVLRCTVTYLGRTAGSNEFDPAVLPRFWVFAFTGLVFDNFIVGNPENLVALVNNLPAFIIQSPVDFLG
jgi:hypothetical protein